MSNVNHVKPKDQFFENLEFIEAQHRKGISKSSIWKKLKEDNLFSGDYSNFTRLISKYLEVERTVSTKPDFHKKVENTVAAKPAFHKKADTKDNNNNENASVDLESDDSKFVVDDLINKKF